MMVAREVQMGDDRSILKEESMKRIHLLLGVVLAVGVALGVFGSRMLSAQDPLKSGTVLQRTELTGAKGLEAILVLRDLPAGGGSGKHKQSGNEIVYSLEVSVIMEGEVKPPVTLKAGEAFHNLSGEVDEVQT